MLVDKDAHQRETITKWPIWVALNKRIPHGRLEITKYKQMRIPFFWDQHGRCSAVLVKGKNKIVESTK